MALRIGISSGDPSGIGPEVILKAMRSLLGAANWVLFTDLLTFEQHYPRFGTGLPYRWIGKPEEANDPRLLYLIEVEGAGCPIPWGDVQPLAGKRAIAYLSAAASAAENRQVCGIVTAPVHKEAIGPPFRGQTEFLADRSHTSRFAMAFFTPTFHVVLATIHVSLREALSQLSTDRYVDLIRLVNDDFRRFGFQKPRIALAGINPHAGEGGMFGSEESEIIKPAVESCLAEGIDVTGPHPADSLYYRAHTGEFDVVIAPYHDQGLVPVKLIAHGETTNVTLGLPYVRTSPDHGTALSIAGKGLADSRGMETAMLRAVDLCRRIQSPA